MITWSYGIVHHSIYLEFSLILFKFSEKHSMFLFLMTPSVTLVIVFCLAPRVPALVRIKLQMNIHAVLLHWKETGKTFSTFRTPAIYLVLSKVNSPLVNCKLLHFGPTNITFFGCSMRLHVFRQTLLGKLLSTNYAVYPWFGFVFIIWIMLFLQMISQWSFYNFFSTNVAKNLDRRLTTITPSVGSRYAFIALPQFSHVLISALLSCLILLLWLFLCICRLAGWISFPHSSHGTSSCPSILRFSLTSWALKWERARWFLWVW